MVDARLRSVVPGYLESRRRDVRSILDALERSDYETIRELGHKMNGTGSSYGFSRVTQLGAAVESAAKEQNSAEIRSRIMDLSRYLDAVKVV
jgi:HPt (histidine-containing phosphotransfer) domain-containing protein